jgi:hypothetical protein
MHASVGELGGMNSSTCVITGAGCSPCTNTSMMFVAQLDHLHGGRGRASNATTKTAPLRLSDDILL